MDSSRTNQLREKIMIAVKSYLSIEHPGSIGTCGKYSPDDFDDYVENALSDDEEIKLALHCLECILCLNGLRIALERDEDAKKKASASDDHLLDKVKNMMDSRDYYAQSSLAFAAAPNDKSGESFGVAVTKDGRYGVLIKCSVWVGDVNQSGSIEIIGHQVIKTADGQQTNEPLEFLTKKLKGIFQTCPALAEYKLDKRKIHVEIKEKTISEVSSLTLSVIIAILNAIHSVKETSPTVYSADVDFSGKLEKVGRIADKIKTVSKVSPSGILIICNKNKGDCPDEHGLTIHAFKNLDDLLKFINYPPLDATKGRNAKKDSDRKSSIPKPKKETEEKSADTLVRNLSIAITVAVLLGLGWNLMFSSRDVENKNSVTRKSKKEVQRNESGINESIKAIAAEKPPKDVEPEIAEEEKPVETPAEIQKPKLVKINTYPKLSSAEKFMGLVQNKTDLKLTIIKKNMGYDVMAVVENTTVEEIHSKIEEATGIKLEKLSE